MLLTYILSMMLVTSLNALKINVDGFHPPLSINNFFFSTLLMKLKLKILLYLNPVKTIA